jgi:threonine dehydrogenase-like Zn-dependent dehydrogenase
MRGAVMHASGEVRVEQREAPRILEPTDAILRVSAACVCGSDLWPYRGIGVEDSMQRLAREFGTTDIVAERGDAGVAAIKTLLRP